MHDITVHKVYKHNYSEVPLLQKSMSIFAFLGLSTETIDKSVRIDRIHFKQHKMSARLPN